MSKAFIIHNVIYIIYIIYIFYFNRAKNITTTAFKKNKYEITHKKKKVMIVLQKQ